MKSLNLYRLLAPFIAVVILISSPDMRADNAIPATELQKKIRLVIEKSGPAVVGLTPSRSGGAGSGVIVSKDGLILSASHVINAGAGDEMTVWLTDGRKVTAKKLGSQTGRDAAMLKIVGGGEWPFAEVRKGNPQRGEWAVAMGHPGGFEPERTPPVRLGRILQAPETESDRGFIVSDCAVSGGDSGGPLFDLDGKVVGIHSSIGLSLEENRHVPVSAFNDDWDRLVKGDSWGGRMFAGGRPREGAILGVQLEPAASDVEGALVGGVVDGSPAAAAGIQNGDIIFKFSGKLIGDAAELVEAVTSKKPGDKVKVSLRRGDNEREVEVELGDAAKLSNIGSDDAPTYSYSVQQGPAAEPPARLREIERKPSFGVRVGDADEGEGAKVLEVIPGSVAAGAGVAVGDVVVGFAGKEVDGAASLVAAVQGHGGGKAAVQLRRDGKEMRLEAAFGERKVAPGVVRRPAKPGEAPRPAVPMAKGFFFDGKGMREINPERLKEMMKGGGFPGFGGGAALALPQRPELGVDIAEGDKAVVEAVVPGSPAEKAGIKPGDEIVGFAGKEVTSFESLVAAVRGNFKGGATEAKVRRGEKDLKLDVEMPVRRPIPRRLGFKMQDGKLVPMAPEELEKMVPQLRDRPAPDPRKLEGADKAAGKAQLGLLIDPQAEGDGALVSGVADGSAAEKAGVKAGDRVLAFGDKKIGSFEDLSSAVTNRKPGDRVKLKVQRDGKEIEIGVELGRAAAEDTAEPAPESAEMTPEKMREMMERMRRGEIKPEDFQRMFGGESPFRRGPSVDPKWKRANGETLQGFEPAASKARGSMVTLKVGGKQVALGTVVDGGLVVTKASQIAGKDGLQVERPDGKMTGAKLVRNFGKHDLALLELEDSRGLKPVRFVDPEKAATVGTLVTAPDVSGNPAGFGVVSVAARSLSEENKGFLGIQIGDAGDAGVTIGEVFDGGAAKKAGLQAGDIIVKAADTKVNSPTELIRQVAGKKPGEKISVEYVRGGKPSKIDVVLRSRADMGPAQERMSQTARMGTRLSDQRTGYPSALTHDMPVEPESCGSPLINLEGEIIGINIARAGRTKTYALPGEVVKALLAETGHGSDDKGKVAEPEESSVTAAALSSLKAARESVAIARKSFEELKIEAETNPALRPAAERARAAMESAQKALAEAEAAFRGIRE